MPWCTARSSAGVAPGKRAERSGRRSAAVRLSVNQPVENVHMTPAHATAGSQRPSGPGLDTLAVLADVGADPPLLAVLAGARGATRRLVVACQRTAVRPAAAEPYRRKM